MRSRPVGPFGSVVPFTTPFILPSGFRSAHSSTVRASIGIHHWKATSHHTTNAGVSLPQQFLLQHTRVSPQARHSFFLGKATNKQSPSSARKERFVYVMWDGTSCSLTRSLASSFQAHSSCDLTSISALARAKTKQPNSSLSILSFSFLSARLMKSF